MPENNGTGASRYGIQIVDNVTGRNYGPVDHAVAAHLAQLYKVIDENNLGWKVDGDLEELCASVGSNPRLEGKQKALDTLLNYRMMCRGGLPREIISELLGQQPQQPVAPPMSSADAALASAAAAAHSQQQTSYPTVPQPQQSLSQPSLEDAIRAQQASLLEREWATQYGETLAHMKLQRLATGAEPFHPPQFQVVSISQTQAVVLMPSVTRFVQGQLLTVNYAVNGKVPKNRRCPDLILDRDSSPFIRSVVAPAGGLTVGESVWVRIIRYTEGSKVRYWVHNESLGCDMEGYYTHYLMRAGQVVQVTEQEWKL